MVRWACTTAEASRGSREKSSCDYNHQTNVLYLHMLSEKIFHPSFYYKLYGLQSQNKALQFCLLEMLLGLCTQLFMILQVFLCFSFS